MGYQIWIVPEVESWLAELSRADPQLSTQVLEAVYALQVAGQSLGPPMVVPVDDWPARGDWDPTNGVDASYQRMLENLTRVRRGVADVATSRKRVRLQLDQLDREAAALGEDPAEDAAARRDAVLDQAASLSGQYDQLVDEEKRLTGWSMRLQRKLDVFRTRKEVMKASHTAAEGSARAEQAMELLDAQLDEALARAEDPPRPGAAPVGAAPDGAAPAASVGAAPAARDERALELYELRPGAPDRIAARLLFTLAGPEEAEASRAGELLLAAADVGDLDDPDNQDEIAVVLAAGSEEDWLRTWYQDTLLLCRSRYLRGENAG
jgi:phage shock protein A